MCADGGGLYLQQPLRPAGDADANVFSEAKPGKPLSNMEFLMLLRRMGPSG